MNITLCNTSTSHKFTRNVAWLNILVHDVINLSYYERWTDKQKNFYVNDPWLWNLQERNYSAQVNV